MMRRMNMIFEFLLWSIVLPLCLLISPCVLLYKFLTSSKSESILINLLLMPISWFKSKRLI